LILHTKNEIQILGFKFSLKMKWVDSGNSKAITSSEKTSSKKAIAVEKTSSTAKNGIESTRTVGNMPNRVGVDSNVSK